MSMKLYENEYEIIWNSVELLIEICNNGKVI